MKFNDEQKEVLIEYISVTRSREPSADNVKLAFQYLEHGKVVNVTPNHRQKIKEIAANIKADFERLSDYALKPFSYVLDAELHKYDGELLKGLELLLNGKNLYSASRDSGCQYRRLQSVSERINREMLFSTMLKAASV